MIQIIKEYFLQYLTIFTIKKVKVKLKQTKRFSHVKDLTK